MITPLDIQNKEFTKALRGYDGKEVDEFLNEVNLSYEKIYKENIELKDKNGMLIDQIKQYDTLEETLKSTLVIAQSTADDVTLTAKKKADLILEEAELKAANIINNAKNDVKVINDQYENLKREVSIFKTRYKSFIQAQLLSVDEFFSDKHGENIYEEENKTE